MTTSASAAAATVATTTTVIVVVGVDEVALIAPLQQILDGQTPIGGATTTTRNAVFIIVPNFVRLPDLHAVGHRASTVVTLIGTRRKHGARAIHAPPTNLTRMTAM